MTRIVPVATLDWPIASCAHENDDASPLQTTRILCAGNAFLDYELRRMELRDLRHGSSFYEGNNNDTTVSSLIEEDEDDSSSLSIDLFSLSPSDLDDLTYYQVLGDIPMHSTFDQIKKAYRKACLLYHPDKTGRGEEDEVFLKVKAAYDTLGIDVGKRKAYDSTVDFDETIPMGDEDADEFYEAYGPVFERNLRFDATNDPEKSRPSSTSGGGSNGKKGRRRSSAAAQSSTFDKPPTLGTDATSMEKVHAFYEYWIHFESWRDFTLQAANELKHDVEAADSRYEKRYYAKEIDKKAKALKREEMARLNLLVERAMAADPRLKRERQREREDKERLVREKKERAEEEKRQQQKESERLAKEKAQQDEKDRQARAVAKMEKEKEKKQLRKARQLFRKMSIAAYRNAGSKSKVWSNLEELNDDIELLCDKLSVAQITELTDALGGPDASDSPNSSALDEAVQAWVAKTKAGLSDAERMAERQRDEARKADAEKLRKAQAAKAMKPWSKEELSALAKAIRKYPAGGANRWDTIALFVNNLCRPEEPRTKEECIEKYNQMSRSKAPAVVKQSSTVSNEDEDTAATWTDEQNKQLQVGLSKYPASMDKNERWSSIAKGVDGRTKKECVQRFKAIREAIKNK